MTDEEKILILRNALETADRKLELILGEPPPHVSEWHYTVALGVRRIIQRGLAKVDKGTANGAQAARAAGLGPALGLSDGRSVRPTDKAASHKEQKPVRIDIEAMKAAGTIKELKRK